MSSPGIGPTGPHGEGITSDQPSKPEESKDKVSKTGKKEGIGPTGPHANLAATEDIGPTGPHNP